MIKRLKQENFWNIEFTSLQKVKRRGTEIYVHYVSHLVGPPWPLQAQIQWGQSTWSRLECSYRRVNGPWGSVENKAQVTVLKA